jgi:hypothetical protein
MPSVAPGCRNGRVFHSCNRIMSVGVRFVSGRSRVANRHGRSVHIARFLGVNDTSSCARPTSPIARSWRTEGKSRVVPRWTRTRRRGGRSTFGARGAGSHRCDSDDERRAISTREWCDGIARKRRRTRGGRRTERPPIRSSQLITDVG